MEELSRAAVLNLGIEHGFRIAAEFDQAVLAGASLRADIADLLGPEGGAIGLLEEDIVAGAALDAGIGGADHGVGGEVAGSLEQEVFGKVDFLGERFAGADAHGSEISAAEGIDGAAVAGFDHETEPWDAASALQDLRLAAVIGDAEGDKYRFADEMRFLVDVEAAGKLGLGHRAAEAGCREEGHGLSDH